MENISNASNLNIKYKNPFSLYKNFPTPSKPQNAEFGSPQKSMDSITKDTSNLHDTKPSVRGAKGTGLPHVYKTNKIPKVKRSNFSKEFGPEFEYEIDLEEDLNNCRRKSRKFNTAEKDDCYFFISSKKCINLNTPLYKRSHHGHKRFKVVKLNLIKKYKLNDIQNNNELIDKYKEKYFHYIKEEDKEEYPLDYDKYTCNTVLHDFNLEFTKSDEDSDYFSI